MSTIKITGKVNSAICYAKVVEEEALDQIKRMCDSPMSEGSKIRIMPDVHSGKGCTIGTTMTNCCIIGACSDVRNIWLSENA